MIRVLVLLSILLWSFSARAEVQITRHIPYGNNQLQIVDVYQPDSCKDHLCPVTMWVHGGGWKRGDTSGAASTKMQTTWAEQGIVMVGVNYRLAPQFMHPAQVEDIAAAIHWVHGNISRYGGDPERISLLGHSAGAHLVALVATNPRYLAAYNLSPKGNLANVFPVDTASFDLTKSSPFVRERIDPAFGKDEKTLREASPIWNVTPDGNYPPFIMATTKVRSNAIATCRDLQEKLKSAKASAEVIIMDYPNMSVLQAHGAIARDLENTDSTMTRALLDRVLGNK